MKIKYVLAVLAASLFSAGVSAQGVVAPQPADTKVQSAPQTQILAQAPAGQTQPTEGTAPAATEGSTAAGGMSVGGTTISDPARGAGVLGVAAIAAVIASSSSSSSSSHH